MIKWFRQKSIIRQQNVRTRYFTRLSLPILPRITLKTTQQLNVACHALLDCKTLTLTELGRNLPTKARTKHNIKRIDRLLGNRHLHKERLAVYRWHASFICSGNTMPIVLVDWSDIREQKRLMVLRASVALHGRSVTLYEKAFPLSEQCSKKAHDQFLADLASILPSNTTPLIVSDAALKCHGINPLRSWVGTG